MTRFVFTDISQCKHSKTVFLACESRGYTYHVFASRRVEADNAAHIAHLLIAFCEEHQCAPIIEDDHTGAAVLEWLYRLGWTFKPRELVDTRV